MSKIPPVYITAEAIAGASLEECITDLVDLAARIGCWVKCNLNGIEVLTPPNATSVGMWQNFQKAQERGVKFVSYNVIPDGRADTDATP